MGAEGPSGRRRRRLAGPLAIAVALVILTVFVGVLGGGKPGSGNQPAPGFPAGLPGFRHPVTSTARTPAPPARAVGSPAGSRASGSGDRAERVRTVHRLTSSSQAPNRRSPPGQ